MDIIIYRYTVYIPIIENDSNPLQALYLFCKIIYKPYSVGKMFFIFFYRNLLFLFESAVTVAVVLFLFENVFRSKASFENDPFPARHVRPPGQAVR